MSSAMSKTSYLLEAKPKHFSNQKQERDRLKSVFISTTRCVVVIIAEDSEWEGNAELRLQPRGHLNGQKGAYCVGLGSKEIEMDRQWVPQVAGMKCSPGTELGEHRKNRGNDGSSLRPVQRAD